MYVYISPIKLAIPALYIIEIFQAPKSVKHIVFENQANTSNGKIR